MASGVWSSVSELINMLDVDMDAELGLKDKSTEGGHQTVGIISYYFIIETCTYIVLY